METAYYFYELNSKKLIPDNTSGEYFDAIIWISAKTSVFTSGGLESYLHAQQTLDDIFMTIAITLDKEDITRAPLNKQIEIVKHIFTQMSTLIIFDNFEKIKDKNIKGFIRTLPGTTKIIITTQINEGIGSPIPIRILEYSDAHQLITQELLNKKINLEEQEKGMLINKTCGIPLAIVWSIGQIAFGYPVKNVLEMLNKPQNKVLSFLFNEVIQNLKKEESEAYTILLYLSLFVDKIDIQLFGEIVKMDNSILYNEFVILERLSLVNKDNSCYSVLPLIKRFLHTYLNQEMVTEIRKWQIKFFSKLGKPCTFFYPFKREIIEKIRNNLFTIFDVIDWSYENKKWETVITLVTIIQDYLAIAGFWNKRIEYGNKALKAAERGKNKKACAYILIDTLTWVLITRGEKETAEKNIIKGLDYAKQTEYYEAQYMAMRFLSRVINNKKEQLMYLEEAEKMVHKTNSQGIIAGFAIYKAFYLMNNDDFEGAEALLKQAIIIYKENEDSIRYARSLADLANIYIKKKKYNDATRIINEAIDIFNSMKIKGTENNLAFSFQLLAEIEKQKGNKISSLEYFYKAVIIYEKLGAISSTSKIKEEISKLENLSIENCDQTTVSKYNELWTDARNMFMKRKIMIDTKIENLVDDKRRGITLIARPSIYCIEKLNYLQKQILKILPGQYYYDSKDFHITILTLIDAHENFLLQDEVQKKYEELFKNTISSFDPFVILFKGITVTSGTIMASGYPPQNSINVIRDILRKELIIHGLGTTLDTRYKNVTAHSVILRFIKELDNYDSVWDHLNTFKNIELGISYIDTFYFVDTNWVLTHDKINIISEYTLQGK